MNAYQNICDTDPNELFEELYLLLEAEEARKALKKSMRKNVAKSRPFVGFPELAFPSDWCPPPALEELPPVAALASVATRAFDRERFFGIEIDTVLRSPTGIVEMIGFRSVDADGYVICQTMYCEPKPERYLTGIGRQRNSGR